MLPTRAQLSILIESTGWPCQHTSKSIQQSICTCQKTFPPAPQLPGSRISSSNCIHTYRYTYTLLLLIIKRRPRRRIPGSFNPKHCQLRASANESIVPSLLPLCILASTIYTLTAETTANQFSLTRFLSPAFSLSAIVECLTS